MLTSQDYSPSSVVYVPEPNRAIKGHLASLEMQSVVMTSSQYCSSFLEDVDQLPVDLLE